MNLPASGYRGRIAPTSSGYLHLGHAATFSVAVERAKAAKGTTVFRCEDLDRARCRPEFAEAAMDDLRWWGLDWQEGPDIGGPFAPYVQSERMAWYEQLFFYLKEGGHVYPSAHSRAEIERAATSRSPVDGEWIFPESLRETGQGTSAQSIPVAWRFRVPNGRLIEFHDENLGPQAFLAGRDFGDFIIWRKDGMPAYELAVVADDAAMRITEVVRGEDLLLSTARQLLLYQAFQWSAPAWYHAPLVLDPDTGQRLAKSRKSLSLRELRAAGRSPTAFPELRGE